MQARHVVEKQKAQFPEHFSLTISFVTCSIINIIESYIKLTGFVNN